MKMPIDTRDNLKRVDAAISYWKKISINRKPYFHVPDLYCNDPLARRPYIVPDTLIPTQIGGNINVDSRLNGRRLPLDEESQDFILQYFLPGGHKHRYDFRMYRARMDHSQIVGYTSIDRAYEFRDVEDLSAIVANTDTATPINLPVKFTRIYFPKTVILEPLGDHPQYWWDDVNKFIAGHDTGGLTELSRDPASFALYELFPDNECAVGDSLTIDGASIISEVAFLPDVRFVKCYYANCLNLFGRQETLTRLLKFYHDRDDRYAVLGTRHITEGTRLKVRVQPLIDSIPTIIDQNPNLANDLRMMALYHHLAQRIMYQGDFLQSLYDLDPLFEFLRAMDCWLKQENSDATLASILSQESSEITDLIEQLIPDVCIPSRLRLAGFDDHRKTLIADIFANHHNTIAETVNIAFEPKNFHHYLENVTINTITTTLNIWSHRFSNLSMGAFNLWHSNINEDGCFEVIIYDNLQGGSGLSNELFNKISEKNADRELMFTRYLRSVADCSIHMAEQIILQIFYDYDADFLYDTFRSIDCETIIEMEIDRYAQQSRLGLRKELRSSLCTFIKLDVRRLLRTPEQAAFYKGISTVYMDLANILRRTPTAIDIIMRLSDKYFYDPRAYALFERYRRTGTADRSELFTRVSEIIPTCLNACPECLAIERQYGGNIFGSSTVDRRLLVAQLEEYNGF